MVFGSDLKFGAVPHLLSFSPCQEAGTVPALRCGHSHGQTGSTTPMATKSGQRIFPYRVARCSIPFKGLIAYAMESHDWKWLDHNIPFLLRSDYLVLVHQPHMPLKSTQENAGILRCFDFRVLPEPAPTLELLLECLGRSCHEFPV